MNAKKRRSSLLAKYSLMYEKNPKSRVFAPLAESYRKIGLHDDAFKVLREGQKYHPDYVLGYIVLANCYFDIDKFELAYSTLKPFTSKNLDNISMQKLFSQICINLGHLEEALDTFKYLLFVNPHDKYIAEQVKLLEDDLLVKDDIEDEFIASTLSEQFVDDDMWVQKDFSNSQIDYDDSEIIVPDETELSPLDKFKQDIKKNKLEVEQKSLDDEYFRQDFDEESEEVLSGDNPEDTPFINHTLVDLYCSQGHYKKAQDVLEHILKLHPTDLKTKNKLDDVIDLIDKEQFNQQFEEIDSIENELHGESTSILKLTKEDFDLQPGLIEKVESAFNEFLQMLQATKLSKNQL